MKKTINVPTEPIATGGMSQEEIAKLVQEGLDSAKEGTYTVEEMDELLRKL